MQRIELANPFLVKIRKLFGRYIFSNLVTKYFLNANLIGKRYYETMLNEFLTLEKFIEQNHKSILSIGAGLGGLEIIINQKYNDKTFFFIERNFVSKKVKYGWDSSNNEAYNDLKVQKEFLTLNQMDHKKINIFDYDHDILPEFKFDLVISLLSLDYHYDFQIYQNYLKKISNTDTLIIFDTIRANYFKKIFKSVETIRTDINKVHKSKRIICRGFLT